MQLILELPDALGEQFIRLPDPDTFIVQVLSQALHVKLPTETKSYRIEDAFGLYKPKRLVSLEEMEQAIVKGALSGYSKGTIKKSLQELERLGRIRIEQHHC